MTGEGKQIHFDAFPSKLLCFEKILDPVLQIKKGGSGQGNISYVHGSQVDDSKTHY